MEYLAKQLTEMDSVMQAIEELAIEGQVNQVPVSMAKEAPNRPRKIIDPVALDELTENVRVNEVISPVRYRIERNEIIITDGWMRILAAQRNKLTHVPGVCINDDDQLKVAVLLNTLSKNLNPVDEAEAYEKLIAEYGINQEQLAERIGRSPATVSQTLKVLSLDAGILCKVKAGDVRLTKGQMLKLAAMDSGEQIKSFNEMFPNHALPVEDAGESDITPITEDQLDNWIGCIKASIATRIDLNGKDTIREKVQELIVQLQALIEVSNPEESSESDLSVGESATE